MNIFPAIDLIDKKAVRLFKGDYNKMTVYSEKPLQVAKNFESTGAEFLHVVDLEGAKCGGTPNFDVVSDIIKNTGLKVEIGGGIRDMQTAEKYIMCGAYRIILGTAAICDQSFLAEAAKKFGEKIAVGADIKDGFVATDGWLEKSEYDIEGFCEMLCGLGIKTVIVTDISKDGAMSGTNYELYKKLSEGFGMDFVASGGVSSLEDIKRLKGLRLGGAIIGKALYTGDIRLDEALSLAREEEAF